jgi:hypothetical protein
MREFTSICTSVYFGGLSISRVKDVVFIGMQSLVSGLFEVVKDSVIT